MIEHPDIDLVAVPYGDLRPGVEAKAVLSAAGVGVDDTSGLAMRIADPRLPGPFQVAAARLLFKRLWRLGIFSKVPRLKIDRAARALHQHAESAGWDYGTYWGWDPESRAAALTRYQPGNDELAQTIWARDWGDVWEQHDLTETDLASSDPELLVDLLTSVDTLVRDLKPPEEEPVAQE